MSCRLIIKYTLRIALVSFLVRAGLVWHVCCMHQASEKQDKFDENDLRTFFRTEVVSMILSSMLISFHIIFSMM